MKLERCPTCGSASTTVTAIYGLICFAVGVLLAALIFSLA